MNKRCILFGGNGFIGKNLSLALIQKGYKVIIASRTKYESKGVEHFICDITNPDSFRNIIQKDDIVFDLVSSSVPFSSVMSPLDEIKNHIFVHAQLFDTVYKQTASKVIFISSGGGIYGKQVMPAIPETAVPKPISPHSIAKLTAEYYLRYFSMKYEVPHLIYRVSNPYGPLQNPKQDFGVITTIINNLRQKIRPVFFNNGKNIRDFIYIDDLIHAIMSSFDSHNIHSVYNVGSGRGTSINEIWKIIKQITDTEIKPKLKNARSFDVEKNVLNIDRISQEYNWQPTTSLQEGLEKTVKYYLE